MTGTTTSPELLEAAACGDTGLVVRLARRASGETQGQTASACGFTQSDISRVERNQRHSHDIRFLQKLAAHFNIPPNLLGLAADPAEPMEPPVNRRQFISGTAAAIATVALPTLDVGDQLTDIRTVTATYRRMDSNLPSHDLVRPVAAHLDMAHGLLQRAATTSSRTWLAQSVSEGASLAAWLAWDRA
ncbi:MAG: helix-turn-helix transcriptional regulator, partial [Acidimicrobiaceae bacterium]|nr:helix-turn-helix transcriptional regulator [Acidimicrobiaceae bacterium]